MAMLQVARSTKVVLSYAQLNVTIPSPTGTSCFT
jgi:hypothetical protein